MEQTPKGRFCSEKSLLSGMGIQEAEGASMVSTNNWHCYSLVMNDRSVPVRSRGMPFHKFCESEKDRETGKHFLLNE